MSGIWQFLDTLLISNTGHYDMEEDEQVVFTSYAWGRESEEIVNQIDQALQLALSSPT